MSKVIKEWCPLKDDRYILILDEQIPTTDFSKYRIDGVEYEMISVHISGEFLLKTIGVKSKIGGFVGKEVEFI